MAGLINTGIWGFISSAKATGKKILNAAGEEIDEWVSTFVSGTAGWMVDKLGNAEFKSVFVRDKFITNEFVYNRIRVTEDEEIISSSIKIASYIDNGDGTFSVYPDLREGDFNPLAEDDLLLGYYHNPNNRGVIYSVQKFTALSDPETGDQSIRLEAEGDSIPYQHMIIVRVGNITNEERQSFIRISSKTNCQYFYDGIDSWSAYDDPEHVKCVLGHADMGLIPGWAREAISGVKRWFGLIADGVIIRGTFILHNDKTIEDELNGREIQIRGDFQIREDGITGKWQEVIEYTKKASDAANSASGSAAAAGEHEKRVEELSSTMKDDAKEFLRTFQKHVEEELSNAEGVITKKTEDATSSLQLTAEDFTLAFNKNATTKVEEASGAINEVKSTAESSLRQTAEDLTLSFNKNVETKTDDANGNIATATDNAKSEIKASADALNATFVKNVEDKVEEANGTITTTKDNAKSDLELTAKNLKLSFDEDLETKKTTVEGEVAEVIKSAKSDLALSADNLKLSFDKELDSKKTSAIGEIDNTKETAKSEITASADGITANFKKEVEKKIVEVNGVIKDSKETAQSEITATAEGLTTKFEKKVETETLNANGEITKTKDAANSEIIATATDLTSKFEQSVTDAQGNIIKEIGTQVTQNAKQWKVEVMGTDKDGNPNSILAAINASKEGIKIKGDKIEIDGNLLVNAIMASGINIDDKFVVAIDEKGKANVTVKGDGIFTGAVKTPFRVYESFEEIQLNPEGNLGFNFTYIAKPENVNIITINNITDEKFNGASIKIYVDGEAGQYLEIRSPNKEPSAFILPGDRSDGKTRDFDIVRVKVGGYLELQGIRKSKDKGTQYLSYTYWIIKNYDSTTMTLLNYG